MLIYLPVPKTRFEKIRLIIINLAPTRRFLYGLISIILSAILCVFIFFNFVNTDAFLQIFKEFNWWILTVIAAVVSTAPFFSALRLSGIVMLKDENNPSFFLIFRSIMLSQLINSITPFKGGDLAKVLFLKKSIGVVTALGSVVLERMIDLFILCILGLVGVVFLKTDWILTIYIMISIGMLVCFISAIFMPVKFFSKFEKFQIAIKDFQSVFRQWIKRPRNIAMTFMGSIGGWCVAISVVIISTRYFNSDFPYGYAFAIFPVAVLAGMTPFTVSGIGTRDSVFILLLSRYITSEEAAFVGLTYTVFVYWYLALLGALFLGICTSILSGKAALIQCYKSK